MHDDIHVIVDSVSDVQDTDLMNHPRMHVLRLIARHGNEEWFDGDRSTAYLFDLVKKTGKLPATSQPPIGHMIEMYTDLVKQGKKVMVINCDSVLSGTYQTCCVAAKQVMDEIPGADIRVIDSKAAGCSICGMANAILKKVEEGISMDDAEAYAYDLVKRTKTYFTLDTLEYLAKGGRIGAVGALLGSIFGIRPIIHVVEDGNIIPFDKVRTRKKALKRLLEIANEQGELEEIFIPNALVQEDAEYLRAEMAAKHPGVPIWITQIGTPLAAHLGPGAIGLFVRQKAQQKGVLIMDKRYITGKQIKDMLLGAYHSFEKNYQVINDLNVFPVPDGDTGTNMMHTMASVARELSAMSDNSTVGEIGLAAAKSAIMGARGNSGVILSQLLRGIGRGLAGKNLASNNELGKAFQYGVLFAYRSVSQPVEGTILTVARGIAKGAYTATRNCEGLEEIFNEAIRVGKLELAETPEKLPALKAAGVVDAGGQGLIAFLEGCLAGLRGEDCAEIKVTQKANVKMQAGDEEPLDLEFPYCTEFIVKGANVDKKTVVDAMTGFGNSLIVAVVEDIVKVHIHSKNPGNVLNTAQQWGTLHDIKIENMVDQHENRIFSDDEEIIQTPVKRAGVGIIAVAAGDGVAKIMRDLGAAEIISGGQSMNPSTEDFINGFDSLNADNIIVFPNNKNISSYLVYSISV